MYLHARCSEVIGWLVGMGRVPLQAGYGHGTEMGNTAYSMQQQ